MSDRVRHLGLPGQGTEHTYIGNEFDELARLTGTTLYKAGGMVILNQHTYQYNAANERTRQTFKEGNYVDYTYDPIGQLKTAKGWGSGGGTNRLHEQFGYAYDKAWNLNYRTNNALVQTFNVNNLNELTSGSRDGTFTVAGTATEPKAVSEGGRGVTNVTVSGTGLSSGSADVYADGSWARTNATLANGINSYTATAQDFDGRTSQDSVSVNLPASPTFAYDANGNLTNDSQRIFEYDFENQLTNVYVANGWRSEFKYDAFGRRRVRKEYTWNGGWIPTNEVRYVCDGLLVVQERAGNNVGLVTYTRGNDLSGTLQGAGGAGGLLARTDVTLPSPHAYYHVDGNGNVTALANSNGVLVAGYRYDPYGNLMESAGILAEANTYRFSSREMHLPTRLVSYLYRFYDCALQRWLNRDPIAERGGLNLFTFIANDCVNSIDAFGLAEGSPCIQCHGVSAQGFCGDVNRFSAYMPGSGPNARAGYQFLKDTSAGLVATVGLGLANPLAGLGGQASKEAIQPPTQVFRGGPATKKNFTPRPEKDANGLSTFDNLEAATKPGAKAQVIDTSKLKNLEALPDAPPPGHVSIAPKDRTLINDWAKTRDTDTVHPLTQELMEAICGEVTRPK